MSHSHQFNTSRPHHSHGNHDHNNTLHHRWWFNGAWSVGESGFCSFQTLQDLYNAILVVFCVVCAGLASGLTVGLLSLDNTKLEMKMKSKESGGDGEAAAIVFPVVKRHHLLLVTLLLLNALAGEALPIFLEALVPPWLSLIISVTFVLVFGEVLPQAYFTGPQQLRTSAKLIPFVKGLITFFFPIAYPISKWLDYAFGCEEESSMLGRQEFEALVSLQSPSYLRKQKAKQKTTRSSASGSNSPSTRSTLIGSLNPSNKPPRRPRHSESSSSNSRHSHNHSQSHGSTRRHQNKGRRFTKPMPGSIPGLTAGSLAGLESERTPLSANQRAFHRYDSTEPTNNDEDDDDDNDEGDGDDVEGGLNEETATNNKRDNNTNKKRESMTISRTTDVEGVNDPGVKRGQDPDQGQGLLSQLYSGFMRQITGTGSGSGSGTGGGGYIPIGDGDSGDHGAHGDNGDATDSNDDNNVAFKRSSSVPVAAPVVDTSSANEQGGKRTSENANKIVTVMSTIDEYDGTISSHGGDDIEKGKVRSYSLKESPSPSAVALLQGGASVAAGSRSGKGRLQSDADLLAGAGGEGRSNIFRAGSFRDSLIRDSGNVIIPSRDAYDKDNYPNADDHYLSRAEEGLSLGSLTGRKTSVKEIVRRVDSKNAIVTVTDSTTPGDCKSSNDEGRDNMLARKAEIEAGVEVEVKSGVYTEVEVEGGKSRVPPSSVVRSRLFKQGRSKGYESGSEVDYQGTDIESEGEDDDDYDEDDDDDDDEGEGEAGNSGGRSGRGGRGGGRRARNDSDEYDEEAVGGGNPKRKNEGAISQYEVDLMTGILSLSRRTVESITIPISDVFMLSDSIQLDRDVLENIWNCGFSRIPVFHRRDRQHITGYLLVKSLVTVDPDATTKTPLTRPNVSLRAPLFVKPSLGLLEMLDTFRETRSHMALICENPYEAQKSFIAGRRPSSEAGAEILGIVTLEDVIEELIRGEITDETDVLYSSNSTAWLEKSNEGVRGGEFFGRISSVQFDAMNECSCSYDDVEDEVEAKVEAGVEAGK